MSEPASVPIFAAANDEDVLVRAGEMRLGDFMRSVEVCFEEHGFYGFSFFSFPERDAGEIAAEMAVVRHETGLRLMPHPSMRQARVVEVRDLGYRIEADNEPRGHVALTFDGQPTEEDWEALDGVFQPPEDNPISL